MKKLFALIFALTLFVGVAASPLWAAGGKNHGSLGEGSVDQGDTGSNVAKHGVITPKVIRLIKSGSSLHARTVSFRMSFSN